MKLLKQPIAVLSIFLGMFFLSTSSFAQNNPCPKGSYLEDSFDARGRNAGKICTTSVGWYGQTPNGIMTPVPCPAGTYNPASGQATIAACLIVPKGFYTDQNTGNYQTTICPAGNTTVSTGSTSIQSCNNPVLFPANLATGKIATQSTTLEGADASRAIDRNDNANSIMHTNNGAAEWWMLNMQAQYNISGIKITNRKDCCSDRMVGGVVQILDASGRVLWAIPVVANQPVYQLTVPNVIGQYVRVLNSPNKYLNMAEVEVFGQ